MSTGQTKQEEDREEHSGLGEDREPKRGWGAENQSVGPWEPREQEGLRRQRWAQLPKAAKKGAEECGWDTGGGLPEGQGVQ